MIYRLFRWFTGVALHWFYSSIEVIGRDRIPADAPILLAASHHNALVDCLIAGWIVPRRLTITAKATLVENPVIGWLFQLLGVVPLRRVRDELKPNSAGKVDATRNTAAFEKILDTLGKGATVLIFPEGKSHSEAELAPLKTGIARIALAARDNRGIYGLEIIPLGLNFEDKGNPGTSVVAEVGEPISMETLGDITVQQLTAQIAERLSAVSLKPPRPSSDRAVIARSAMTRPFVSPMAAWGELTHRYLINIARDHAVRRSRNPDDPAMLTIVFGLILILVSYAAQFTIVAVLTNKWWAAGYVLTLPLGAYWAAFSNHPPSVSPGATY